MLQSSDANSLNDDSQFANESNESTHAIDSQTANTTILLPCQMEIRTQSSYFHDDESIFPAHELDQLLVKDLENRITQVGENIAGFMFPDDAFGFAINDQFVENFYGSFISSGGLLDKNNFKDDKTTSLFLNRMISTITHFLNATGQVSFKPFRYFTAIHSSKALQGHAFQRKPDIMLLHLIDGYIPDGPFKWSDPQAFIEHTREKKPPMRLKETVAVKSYLSFCCQPERDYVICVCITGEGFHVVMTDHVGQIETDSIPFDRSVSTMVFIRIIMGLAFLPDFYLGVDTTIIRHKNGKHTNVAFDDTYKPFTYNNNKPHIMLFANSPTLPAKPFIIPSTPGSPDVDNKISMIMVGTEVYKVIRLLFRSQTLIGRATRAFLVEFPDGRLGVLKDSWITIERGSEAVFLEGLDIPYGPDLVDHSVLRKTDVFRKTPISPSPKDECRQKRRIVTYPAGVHISDFTSLLELMFAFFDIVLSIFYLEDRKKVHRDISYTNLLLREPGSDSPGRMAVREKFIKDLDLSNIEDLRRQISSREGLLIDYDYATVLADTEVGMDTQHVPSGDRTGTLPFIAMDLLKYRIPHRVAHDLESVIYVLLFLCTHLKGPRNAIRDTPLYGGDKNCENPSGMKLWIKIKHPQTLGHLKYSHMIGHFDDEVLSHISPYFYPLKPHISNLWKAMFPERLTVPSIGRESTHSKATCLDIINVFKSVFADDLLIEEAKQTSTTLGKRSHPGDLISSTNGWDAVNPSQEHLIAEPKKTPTTKRRTKLMTKARKF